jgi:hypothetical protein
MLRKFVIFSALLVCACSMPTMYTETDDEIRIHFGGGGLLKGKLDTYRKMRMSGKRVVIDGQVVSADAFFAFNLPRACYTEKAVFSPHSASYLGLVPAPKITRTLAHYLPPPLRDWFKGNIAYHDWIGFAYVDYQQLRQIWPEGACPEDSAPAVDRMAKSKRWRPVAKNR